MNCCPQPCNTSVCHVSIAFFDHKSFIFVLSPKTAQFVYFFLHFSIAKAFIWQFVLIFVHRAKTYQFVSFLFLDHKSFNGRMYMHFWSTALEHLSLCVFCLLDRKSFDGRIYMNFCPQCYNTSVCQFFVCISWSQKLPCDKFYVFFSNSRYNSSVCQISFFFALLDRKSFHSITYMYFCPYPCITSVCQICFCFIRTPKLPATID